MRSLLTNQNRTEAEKPVSSAVRQRQSLMFRARSYMAFAITPQAPIVEWLAELDTSLERSESFFSGHPVALDLSTVNLSAAAIMHLVENLAERKIRVLGITGVDPAIEQPGLPPILRGGRGPQQTTPDLPKAPTLVVEAAPPPRQQPASLLIETPVRSGQSVVFVDGDVTVLGSVGSGRRDRGRRLGPHLRHAARPGDGRRQRQFPRPHFLPTRRGRAARHRLLLQDR